MQNWEFEPIAKHSILFVYSLRQLWFKNITFKIHFHTEKPFGDKFNANFDTQPGVVTQFVEFTSDENPSYGQDFISAI